MILKTQEFFEQEGNRKKAVQIKESIFLNTLFKCSQGR